MRGIHILVTGGSGMLGRAVISELCNDRRFFCRGVSNSRTAYLCDKLDLTNEKAVVTYLNEHKIDVVVHTAAIRKPDQFDSDVDAACKLNVDATETIARWCAENNRFLVFISSDYVFDGTKAPYSPDDPVCAVNAYGQSKVDAENIIRGCCAKNSVILRVPVLYGWKLENLAESSVSSVIAVVCKTFNGEKVVLDDWAVRYPTTVENISSVIRHLIVSRSGNSAFCGTFHWSAPEALTKFDMGMIIAEETGADKSLIQRSGAPANGSAVRPKDCHLDRSALECAGVADDLFRPVVRRLIEEHCRINKQ